MPEQSCVCGSVGTVLFTALGISFAAIALHGAFRQPDDLFTDEPEVTWFDCLCLCCMICGDASATQVYHSIHHIRTNLRTNSSAVIMCKSLACVMLCWHATLCKTVHVS